MNKFDLMNKVMVSDLAPEDKCLLVELILRADENWQARPSVERLCKARGIKYEKNFKGADYYLPGLVTKVRSGRRNVYVINTPAVAGLSQAGVTIKHTDTPAVEGANTPAVADNTPAVEGVNTPAVEGANNTEDTTYDSSVDNSVVATVANAPVPTLAPEDDEDVFSTFSGISSNDEASLAVHDSASLSGNSSVEDTPATEGVFNMEAHLQRMRETQARFSKDRKKVAVR